MLWRGQSTHHRCLLHCCLHSCCDSHTGCFEADTDRSHTRLLLAYRMLHVLHVCANTNRKIYKSECSTGHVFDKIYNLQATDIQHLASSRPSEQSFTPSHTFLRGMQRPSPQRNWRGQAGDRQEACVTPCRPDILSQWSESIRFYLLPSGEKAR